MRPSDLVSFQPRPRDAEVCQAKQSERRPVFQPVLNDSVPSMSEGRQRLGGLTRLDERSMMSKKGFKTVQKDACADKK